MAFRMPLGCLAGRTLQWSGHLRGGRDQHRCRLWAEQTSGNACKAHTRRTRVCKGCVKGLSTQEQVEGRGGALLLVTANVT